MEKTVIQILPELVEKQLLQILQHEELKRSPILARFLEFVVLSKLQGKEEEIKEYTIGVKALGKPTYFNPQMDAVVRIHASRLRNILSRYYHGVGKNDLIFIDIPKGSYVPVFQRNNMNTEVMTPIVDSEGAINSDEVLWPQSKAIYSRPVLAVLPFQDLGPDNSRKHFLNSFAEQLTTELARFDTISIISYDITQNFDPATKDMRELHKENQIDYVLTGSLRLLNKTLRLNIQLLMVENGNILWSDSFQRNDFSDKNTMAIQDEIIGKIANVVADDHGMAGKLNKLKPCTNPEENNGIRDAIHQYFEYTYNCDSKKFDETLHSMENAYRSNDDNALVVAILGKLYLDKFAYSLERNQSVLDKGLELVNKAVRLDPRSQQAQKALAWGLVLSGQNEKSGEVIDRCLALNPIAASNLGTVGLSLIMKGEYDNGCLTLKRALELSREPSRCIKLGFALLYYRFKNYEESRNWLDRLAPFELPFATLLRIAINGNITGKCVQTGELVFRLDGQEQDIVERIVFDSDLRNEIAAGWRKAGYTPRSSFLQLSA